MPTRPPMHRTSKPAPPPDYIGIRALRSSYRWQCVRMMKLKQSPLCEVCEKNGRTTAAVQVHHRIDLCQRIDLAFDIDNLESVCTECHSIIHKQRKGE